MKVLRLVSTTIRLAILRVGIGWMFALLTFNFNRIAVYELGAVAVLITTLVGLHHFLSPFQVFWGRLSDRYPVFGYRRSPHLLLSAVVASLVFMALPGLAIRLGQGDLLAIVAAFGLVAIFGMAIAANGASTNALVAESTSDNERGAVVGVVWTFVILSGIISAQVAKQIMPVYDPVQMQFLYNLTPLVVIGSTLIGLIGLERRVSAAEQQAFLEHLSDDDPATQNAFRVTWQLLQHNRQVRGFFAFVLLAILGIFLQDAILEIFGAEVFGMTPGETATFQQSWGGGVLLGMLVVGFASWLLPISKKMLATLGGLGIALSLGMLAVSGMTMQAALVNPALVIMGVGAGVFNIGALSMMMEMTVEGSVGLYMGLWGMAQGLGTGIANVLSGLLHTLLIETGLLVPASAYTLIFGLEALIMVLAVGVLRSVSVQDFRGLDPSDVRSTMAFDTAA